MQCSKSVPHTELYEVLSKYTQINGYGLIHSHHSMHMFQKAQNALQLSSQISLQGGRAWRYTAVRNTVFCRRRWPLWELFSCLIQTYSSKHPIANIARRWLSVTWQGRAAFWNKSYKAKTFQEITFFMSVYYFKLTEIFLTNVVPNSELTEIVKHIFVGFSQKKI